MRAAGKSDLSTRPAFVDANVLINAFDTAASEGRREPAIELLERGFSGEARLAVSNQVLGELLHALTRSGRRRTAVRDARSIVEDFVISTMWTRLEYGCDTVARGADIAMRHGIDSWDAVIVATMQDHGISKIYTENDEDFAPVPGLEVINPSHAPARE